MFHFQTYTETELASFSGFMILKNDGIFQPKDYMCVTVRNDVEEAEDVKEDKRLTRKQIFFTVTEVQTSETTRGVRRGYALVKLKRTKNPLPKVDEAEIEEQVKEDE